MISKISLVTLLLVLLLNACSPGTASMGGDIHPDTLVFGQVVTLINRETNATLVFSLITDEGMVKLQIIENGQAQDPVEISNSIKKVEGIAYWSWDSDNDGNTEYHYRIESNNWTKQ